MYVLRHSSDSKASSSTQNKPMCYTLQIFCSNILAKCNLSLSHHVTALARLSQPSKSAWSEDLNMRDWHSESGNDARQNVLSIYIYIYIVRYGEVDIDIENMDRSVLQLS